MTNEKLMETFSSVEFHVGPFSEGGDGDGYYMVAAFGEHSSEFEEVLHLTFCDDFDPLDLLGNVQLDDNGEAFETVNDATDALVYAFSIAINEGVVTEEAIRAQVRVWPYGVSRSVFNVAPM
jgi:hypothetical protein